MRPVRSAEPHAVAAPWIWNAGCGDNSPEVIYRFYRVFTRDGMNVQPYYRTSDDLRSIMKGFLRWRTTGGPGRSWWFTL